MKYRVLNVKRMLGFGHWICDYGYGMNQFSTTRFQGNGVGSMREKEELMLRELYHRKDPSLDEIKEIGSRLEFTDFTRENVSFDVHLPITGAPRAYIESAVKFIEEGNAQKAHQCLELLKEETIPSGGMQSWKILAGIMEYMGGNVKGGLEGIQSGLDHIGSKINITNARAVSLGLEILGMLSMQQDPKGALMAYTKAAQTLEKYFGWKDTQFLNLSLLFARRCFQLKRMDLAISWTEKILAVYDLHHDFDLPAMVDLGIQLYYAYETLGWKQKQSSCLTRLEFMVNRRAETPEINAQCKYRLDNVKLTSYYAQKEFEQAKALCHNLLKNAKSISKSWMHRNPSEAAFELGLTYYYDFNMNRNEESFMAAERFFKIGRRKEWMEKLNLLKESKEEEE